MQGKSKIIRRLNILYIAFFLVVILGITFSFMSYDFIEGFREGIKEGIQQQAGEKTETNEHRHFIFPTVPLLPEAKDYHLLCHAADSTYSISARTAFVDVKINGSHIRKPASFYILICTSIICFALIFILIFAMLLSIRYSIKRNDIFSRNNITFIRAIGSLLIIASLLYDWGRYVEIKALAALLDDNTLRIAYDGISFKDIITGVLMLIIGEIFAIGYDITEEQKLTI